MMASRRPLLGRVSTISDCSRLFLSLPPIRRAPIAGQGADTAKRLLESFDANALAPTLQAMSNKLRWSRRRMRCAHSRRRGYSSMSTCWSSSWRSAWTTPGCGRSARRRSEWTGNLQGSQLPEEVHCKDVVVVRVANLFMEKQVKGYEVQIIMGDTLDAGRRGEGAAIAGLQVPGGLHGEVSVTRSLFCLRGEHGVHLVYLNGASQDAPPSRPHPHRHSGAHVAVYFKAQFGTSVQVGTE